MSAGTSYVLGSVKVNGVAQPSYDPIAGFPLPNIEPTEIAEIEYVIKADNPKTATPVVTYSNQVQTLIQTPNFPNNNCTRICGVVICNNPYCNPFDNCNCNMCNRNSSCCSNCCNNHCVSHNCNNVNSNFANNYSCNCNNCPCLRHNNYCNCNSCNCCGFMQANNCCSQCNCQNSCNGSGYEEIVYHYYCNQCNHWL